MDCGATDAGRTGQVIHQGVDSCHGEAGGGDRPARQFSRSLRAEPREFVNNTNSEDHIFGP